MILNLELPETLATRLKRDAEERELTVEDLVLAVLTEHFGQPRRRLGFAAFGRSTSGRRAADAEVTLAEGGFESDSPSR